MSSLPPIDPSAGKKTRSRKKHGHNSTIGESKIVDNTNSSETGLTESTQESADKNPYIDLVQKYVCSVTFYDNSQCLSCFCQTQLVI